VHDAIRKLAKATRDFVRSEVLRVIVDRATQMCAGLGVSGELPVAKIAREIRPFRVYDGPSEVHRWSIAKRAVRAIVEGQR
jgi:alkylation response protein AidB-like acyl-CoA dehydrogenase